MPRFLYIVVLACAIAAILSPDRAAGQETVAYNTILFDTLNPSPANRYSAIWGYTAPDGREYALLGGFTGTHIIDITTRPVREVAFIPGPANGWREMKTWRTYAYVVSEGGAGLQIIDLSDLPASATLVKSDTSVFRTGHTISQEGKWLYVHGSNTEAGANRGTLIFNVGDNPENPKLVGQYDRNYVHDAVIRNDTMYAAMILDGRLDVVYLGPDRSAPELVTDITYPGAGTHNADLTIDGRYIMTTDEVGETEKTLKVWDRGDIGDIAKVADWSADEDAIIHNVHIRGTVAYIAWYTAGTRIVDISDPLNPVEIGFYDMFPGSGKRFAGNWGVYPYFASGKIIASDMGKGLFVFTFDGAKKGMANGVVLDAMTGDPIDGAIVELPGLGRKLVTDATGTFQILAAEGDAFFTATAQDYQQASGTLTLSSDGSHVEILLEPLELRDVRIVAIDDESGEEIEKFSFDVRTRGETIADGAIPKILHLPADSGYSVRVGAWGWLPEEVTIDPDVTGDIEVRLKRGYSDDAELHLGWSLGEPDDDGVGGEWERGVPVGVSVQLISTDPIPVEPATDHTPGSGTKAFLTEIIDDPETAPGAADVDSGRVTLTSPEFDLSGYEDPTLSFALWYSNDALPIFQVDDRLYVRLSNDGGQSWVDVVTLDSGTPEWQEHSLRIADFLAPTASMHFRVVASDSGEQGWTEAGLDDFLITDIVTSGVTAGASDVAAVSVAPNPARGTVSFDVHLGRSNAVLRLELFDLLGRKVATIHQGAATAGMRRYSLDAGSLAEGQYLWRLTVNDSSTTSGVLTVLE